MTDLVKKIISGSEIDYTKYSKGDLNCVCPPSNITPLHASVVMDNPEATEDLLQFGAAVNARDVKGNTPLHVAALFAENLKVVELLLDYGADPNALNYMNEHCLVLLTRSNGKKNNFTGKTLGGRTEIIKEILLRDVKLADIRDNATLNEIAKVAAEVGIGIGKFTTRTLESSGKLKFK